MIFNRTIQDVREADAIRKSGNTLTQDDIDILERGTITYNTLNRIESKQEELESALRDMGYYVIINNTTWTRDDVFRESDENRIVSNNIALRQAFFALKKHP